jgi:hypothetical protein
MEQLFRGCQTSGLPRAIVRILLIVRIVPLRKRKLARVRHTIIDIPAEAYCAEKAEGRYVTIYMQSVERIAEDCQSRMATLLGHITAHEIGHLLLGPQHTTGIMAAELPYGAAAAAQSGESLFAGDDACKLVERARARVGASQATRNPARRTGR